jgi:hypothetical protein
LQHNAGNKLIGEFILETRFFVFDTDVIGVFSFLATAQSIFFLLANIDGLLKGMDKKPQKNEAD